MSDIGIIVDPNFKVRYVCATHAEGLERVAGSNWLCYTYEHAMKSGLKVTEFLVARSLELDQCKKKLDAADECIDNMNKLLEGWR